jgi:micrococcal nuclease
MTNLIQNTITQTYNMASPPLFYYNATVESVYDGDTITCTIDCGFNMFMKKQKIRLTGIDTAEIRGDTREEGIIVRDIVRKKILGKQVVLKTEKDRKGKYGRYIATVYLDGCDINQWLIEQGYATVYGT